MAAAAARKPSGKVSVVFTNDREREGAYDFLESKHVKREVIAESLFKATTSRIKPGERVTIAIDGSSLSLKDSIGSKGLGPVGSKNREVRGLMMVNALAVTRDGVPLGLTDQVWWNRPGYQEGSHWEQEKKTALKAFEEKEPSNFIVAAKKSIERLDAVGARAWLVMDRGADSRDLLMRLHELTAGTPHIFTVRAAVNRRLVEQPELLQQTLDASPQLGTYEVRLPRKGKKAARTAKMEVHAMPVTLRFVKRHQNDDESLQLFAVRVREIAPKNGERVEWTLYTNAPVLSAEQAREVVQTYQARWRIEEFHRTWKQGECNVEDAQLHTINALIIWATILAGVATRIERLKYLSRTTPDVAAIIELSPEEIEALQLDQIQRAEPRRITPPDMPTIGEATAWIAQLGGWIKSNKGPPGSMTISRGLERLGLLVHGIALARKGRLT